MHSSRIFLRAATWAALVFVGAAHADGFVNVYDISLGTSANAIGNLHAHQNLNRYIHQWDSQAEKGKAASRKPAGAPVMHAPLLLVRASRGDTASGMAANMPEAQRAQAERAYRQALGYYAALAKKFGVPPHDLAGAVAAYLAGSWMAYHNASFPDEHFVPLVNQMRRVVGASAAYAQASEAERLAMHERMAIVGVMLASTQVSLARDPRSPQAPQLALSMKRDAKAALESFLKTDASRVRITAQGLVVR